MISVTKASVRSTLMRKDVIYAIIAVNLLGTAFGFYYYRFQFAEVSPLLWIFVADSPVSTLAVAVSLYLKDRSLKTEILDAYAFSSNFKYGLWTVVVLLVYWQTFAGINSTPMYLFLVLSHFGMFLQSFLVFDYADVSLRAMLAPAALLINDTLDYTLNIHSSLHGAESGSLSAALVAAVVLSLSAALVVYRRIN